jgi:hypothetical protein
MCSTVTNATESGTKVGGISSLSEAALTFEDLKATVVYVKSRE